MDGWMDGSINTQTRGDRKTNRERERNRISCSPYCLKIRWCIICCDRSRCKLSPEFLMCTRPISMHPYKCRLFQIWRLISTSRTVVTKYRNWAGTCCTSAVSHPLACSQPSHQEGNKPVQYCTQWEFIRPICRWHWLPFLHILLFKLVVQR
jgi:hypothetical protein